MNRNWIQNEAYTSFNLLNEKFSQNCACLVDLILCWSGSSSPPGREALATLYPLPCQLGPNAPTLRAGKSVCAVRCQWTGVSEWTGVSVSVLLGVSG